MAERIRTTQVRVFDSKEEMGSTAAAEGAQMLRYAIDRDGEATIIVATGASQFEMLAALVEQDVDWSRVTMFHLDEYVDLPAGHPASFRKYLTERFTSKVPLGAVNFLSGETGDPQAVCDEMGQRIRRHTVDVAFVGIGENGHLAFNDPPADFETDSPYLLVELDEACRRQQAGEGWFDSVDDVPDRAISMSVREILRARTILCTCPDDRKAVAVRKTLDGEITPDVPASVLRTHPDCRFFLDAPAAALLRGITPQ